MRTGTDAALVAIALMSVLSGCASVQRDARFPEVRDAVGQRVEQNVSWNQNSEQDRRAQQAVQRLLKQELTPDTAVQIALLNNRNLQATYENIGVAQADLVEAGLLDNPVFSISVYSGDPGTIIEASIVQDFVSLFSLSARKKIGEAAARRATLEVSNKVVDLARQVEGQYYTVVGDAQALELAQQVVVATEAAAQLAERQRAAGNLNRRDQSVQQAFYAQTMLEVAQAEAQLTSDRERLNRLMGVWAQDTGWTIPGRLPALPVALPALDQLEARAVAERLDLAAAKADAEAATRALDLATQFRYLGPLGIGVAYKREPGGGAFIGPTVELGLPLFNQHQAGIARAAAESRRSQEHVAALAIEIRSESREASARLAATYAMVQHYQKVMLPLQQSIVSETLKFYNGMLVGVYDLLLARQAQVQTARQYVSASKDFWLAWTDLERAIGGKIPLPAATVEEAPDAPDPSHQHGDKQP